MTVNLYTYRDALEHARSFVGGGRDILNSNDIGA